MIKKNLMIAEMLKNWYFIDSVLLNEHAKKIITDDKDYQEYINLKSALLTDLYEFYNYINYSPKASIPKNTKMLQENAVKDAKKTKKVSSKLLENVQVKKQLKESIMKNFQKDSSQDINKLSDRIINERFLKMSLDNMLVGVPILECKNQDKVGDFKSSILEQAYLTVRSEMIQIAKKYNPVLKKNLTEGVAKYGLVAVLGFLLSGPVARTVESFQSSCKIRCGVLRLNTYGKKICVAKCDIQTHQKIVAELKKTLATMDTPEAKEKILNDIKKAQMKIAQLQSQISQYRPKVASEIPIAEPTPNA